MPDGVDVVVAEGFATIDFVDSAKRGAGLDALLKIGTPPALIEKLSRSGPRALYVVPEGNAREAGLLDEVSQVDALEVPVTSSATDATGAVPPEFPSTGDLYAQTVRGGSYADGYAEGGFISPGTGVVGEGIEVQVGETVELVGVDTGGPYETLPEIENPDGTAELDPIEETAPVDEPKGYDDGKPDSDWSRPQLNAYATQIGIVDADKLRNRAEVLAAIKAKEAEQTPAADQ